MPGDDVVGEDVRQVLTGQQRRRVHSQLGEQGVEGVVGGGEYGERPGA